ncbi:MAG: penicillin-binding protein 2 [Candidatus Korobacteraceae bacterium]|jgi:penicillin-binding protein 2
MYGREEKVPLIRLAIAQYIILGIFLLLIFGLWRLQVLHSDYYTSMAEQNRVKEVPILAPRGKLLDREGRPIVDNYPSFSALLLRSQGKLGDSNLEAIALGLHLDADELKARVKRLSAMPGYQPIFIKYDITPDELAFVESHRNEFPELDTITVHRRLYPRNGFMAHLIGYVGEVSEDMLNNPRFELYNSGDIVGQSGVEAEYNDMLMGKNGSRRVLVNSKGKEVGELSDTPAIPGKQLQLTIDLDLQIAAEEVLGDNKNGAIIAMDPKTGEILALASRPAFDPNAFAVRISGKEWQALMNDPGKPLLNKAIQAQLAPGSTFKIIMSVAGWQEGIAQTLHVNCTGGATFYGRRFGCWLKGGHGGVDLPRAIYQSCDVFFYTLAERLGIERIAKYATLLGLGQKTGIDLPQEASGIMPSEEWKLKNFRQKWFAGETISVGIGQGAVATTPVQLMRAISAISMGGHMVRPHVVFPDKVPETYRNALKYNETTDIPIDPKGWETITDAMARVLLPEGTAPSAHIPGIEIAGKTGSAQTVSLALRAKYANKAEFAQNGWFVGFTPKRNPDVIVCVLFQGGEHGRLAARLATQVIKAYVDKQNHKPLEHLKPPPEGEEQGAPQAVPGSQGRNRMPKHNYLEVSGLWSDPGSDRLQAARFGVKRGEETTSHRALAAPGMEQFAQPPAPSASGRQRQRYPPSASGRQRQRYPPSASGRQRQRYPSPVSRNSWPKLHGMAAALSQPLWRAGGLH